MNCDFIKDIDFYGKEPEFYFKGKPKKITWIGRIFTIFYIIIYLIFFVYKLYRMSQRVDITFYDTYSDDKEDIPSINVTNENFYIIFSLINGNTDEPIIDESIYYPVAYFKDEEVEEIEIETCNIDKIGSRYKKFYKDSQLDKYYCLNKVNHTLRAYMNSFSIKIFPCKNTTENNNHCKPKDIIDSYLNGNNFVIKLEDILITPNNFKFPIKERINDLYTTLFKNFGQYLYIEMQLINIETNNNIIGFDFLTNEKNEEFIKYDTLEIIPQPGYDLDDDNNEYPACEIEFQLKDKVLTEKRYYTQLIDVLGEIGGFMEIISSFFDFICSFVVDILYEKSIVNNLFSFDLKKKLVLIKNNRNKVILKDKNEIKTNESNSQSNQQTLPIGHNRNKKKILIEIISNSESNDKNTDNSLVNKKKIKKRNLMDSNSYKSENENENFEIQSFSNNLKTCNMKESNININLKKMNQSDLYNVKKNNQIVNSIKSYNYLVHLCFCFVIKTKNKNNVLLNEAMNLISEKLDILYLFRCVSLQENFQRKLGCELEMIKMSEECIKSLRDLKIK